MSTPSEQPTREPVHRWWNAGPLPTLLLAGLVGGLIGGAIVGLVGRWTGWWTPPETASAACAVDRVAAEALPSVVTIGVLGPGGSGSGSGVVYRLPSDEAVIITNAHVVAPPGSGSADGGATTIRLEYADGHSDAGRILGMDQVTDLAVVTAATPYPAAPPIAVGDSGSLRVGNPVVALGAPLGLTSTVTSGIVSATGRYVRVPTEAGAAHLLGAIQTDAAINPGNSGGALVNCSAQLVGINTAGAAPAGETGSSGLGFAIPMGVAEPLVAQLAENGRVAHTTLGLQVIAVPPAMQASAGGPVIVQAVTSGGPADKAGVKRGDVLIDVAGQQVRNSDDLVRVELGLTAGEKVPVTVSRNGREQTLTLEPVAS
jgi:putative serine protease PepD